MKTKKQLILDTVTDMVADFLYYDRKEDEDLPVGDIEKSVSLGIVSIDEIVAKFEAELRKVM